MFAYETKKGSYLQGAIIAVIMAVAVVGAGVVIISSLLSGCGNSSDSNNPIYGENGVCVENCNNNGDSYVALSDNGLNGDTPPTYADGKPIPQTDTTPYVCPAKESAQEICFLDLKSKCITADEAAPYLALCGSPEDGLKGKDCYCYGPYAYDEQTGGAKSCTTQKQCQQLSPDKYPPCVCWEFCGFLGEWDCPSSVWAFSFLPDEGDGLCHFGSSGEGALGKPGDPNPRYPLDGTPEQSYILSPDGQTLTSLTSGVKCTKMVPAQ